MADPVKPLNRLKPFQRINNDDFVVAAPPDGLGVPCGCHTPDEFANLEQEFKDFLDSRLPLPLLKVLDTVGDIAKAAAEAARAAAVAAATALAAAQGLLGGPIASVIAAILGFATAVAAITAFVNDVVGVITTVLRGFMIRIGRRLALRAIRVIPQWVPVLRGASSQRITRDQIKEVEGIVTRSYGDPIEPPFFQWHTWLNWSIHVQPEERYKNVISPAGNPPNTEGAQTGERAIARPGSFEIQWDTGALFEQPMTFRGDFNDPFALGFRDTEMPDVDGPMTSGDWIWPMTGMFVWASGRWVYDCSRTTPGANPKMCAMMNPPRAIATATWEAVQFAENDPGDQKPSKVPAIRFMFFACKRGGYLSYDTIADQDYEFILDLPPLEQKVAPFPIGSTPDFPHNTIVVRPRLLKGRVSLPFAGARLLDPIIAEIPSADPNVPPKQAKITIPKSQLEGAEAAGVILSLGWFDPNLERAATVKKCSVSFGGLEGRFTVRDDPVRQIREMFKKEEADLRKEIAERVAKIKILGLGLDDIPVVPNPFNPGQQIDLGGDLKKLVAQIVDKAIEGFIDELAKLIGGRTEKEEWLLRVGVNGRWQSRYFPNLDRGAFAMPQSIGFEVFLGPDDFFFFSSGGVEFNPVGDMMRAAKRRRELTKRNGPPFTWNEIVNATGDDRRELIFQYALEVLAGNSASANPALGLENTLLGIVDPDFSRPGDIPEASNPLRMKDVTPQSVQFTRLARFARATGEELILVENPRLDDYQLTALIQISSQR
jgi:hypothetical protein